MIGNRAKPSNLKIGTDGETLPFLAHSVAQRYQRLVAEDFQKLQECLRELGRLSALAPEFQEKAQLINCSKVAQSLIGQIANTMNTADPRISSAPKACRPAA